MAHFRGGFAGLALAAICLTSCASPSKIEFARPDGADNPQQFAMDRLACEGEAEKANLTAGENKALGTAVIGYSRPMMKIYAACMAGKGYLPVDK